MKPSPTERPATKNKIRANGDFAENHVIRENFAREKGRVGQKLNSKFRSACILSGFAVRHFPLHAKAAGI
jgi:hypothetical protein